jgi:type I restriction enzyme, S subunit
MSSAISWPIARLAQLAASDKGAIAGGPFGSDLVSADYVSDGVPVIRGVNLPRHSRLALDSLVFVSEAKADALHLNCALPGDLVFTQRGTLGQIGLIPNDSTYRRYVISQSQMKMTVDAKKADALYLYYYFSLPSTVKYIENHALQSGVPHINLGILRRLEVVAPRPEVQRKIAAILSAYDDLIANNRRRIALLETMAQEVYREWFVRIRFPGSKQAELLKGMPVSWRSRALSNYCRIVKGKSYAAEDLTDDETAVPFVTLKSFNRRGGYRAEGLKFYKGEFKPEQQVRQGDLVMAVTDMTQDRVVVGQAARIPNFGGRSGVISLDVIKLVPTAAHPTFLYLFLRYSGFADYIKEFANGANVLHLKPDLVSRQEVVFPPEPLQEQFAVLVEPMLTEAERLADICHMLAKTRDALMPRLISGRLKIDRLDIRPPLGMPTEAAA